METLNSTDYQIIIWVIIFAVAQLQFKNIWNGKYFKLHSKSKSLEIFILNYGFLRKIKEDKILFLLLLIAFVLCIYIDWTNKLTISLISLIIIGLIAVINTFQKSISRIEIGNQTLTVNNTKIKSTQISLVEIWDNLILVRYDSNQVERLNLSYKPLQFPHILKMMESLKSFCTKNKIEIQDHFEPKIELNTMLGINEN